MPVNIKNPFRRTGHDVERSQHNGDDISPGTAPNGGGLSLIPDADNAAYKLSVVSDSGEYLPPSPPGEEKSTLWGSRRRKKNITRPVQTAEQFPISRESFEGYRRSFDIGATSPVLAPPTTPTTLPLPGLPMHRQSDDGVSRVPSQPSRPSAVEEPEAFEDVAIDDDADAKHRKKGFFGRLNGAARNPVGRKQDANGEAELTHL